MRGAAGNAPRPRYWRRAPTHGVEVALEDAATAEVVGWDGELNVPTTTHNSLLLLPVDTADPADGAAAAPPADAAGGGGAYWLVDSSTNMLLYLHGWVLRAAPLSYDDPSKQFLLVPLPPPPPPPPPANASAAPPPRAAPATFHLLDRATRRVLFWRDDVVRVAPLDDPRLRGGGAGRNGGGAYGAWRLRRLADHDCPHWAPALHRRNQSTPRWAVRVAAVAFGQCDGVCESGPIVRSFAALLDPHRRLTAVRRASVCAVACAAAAAVRGGAKNPFGGEVAALPGCLCDASPPRADCGCRAAAAPAPRYSLDATPMLHRTYAPWRMVATLPRPAALRFVALLRAPEARAVSHFRMLQKLASRGQEWAQVTGRRCHHPSPSPPLPPPSLTSHILPPAAVRAQRLRRRAPPRRGRRPRPLHPRRPRRRRGGAPPGRPPLAARVAPVRCGGVRAPRVRRRPVAVRFGTRLGQERLTRAAPHHSPRSSSLYYRYAPQIKHWLNSFAARQLLVLTLDEFAAAPKVVLSRIATFLGVAPFPRLVRNWKWEWNAHSSTRGAVAASNATVGALRHFFAPYDGALAALLRRNGQPHAALYVRKWAAVMEEGPAAAAAAAAAGRKRDGGEKQRARRPPRAKAAEKKLKKKAARAEAKVAEAAPPKEGKEEAKPGKGKEARAERKAAKAAAKAAAKLAKAKEAAKAAKAAKK